jgi:hypothetical protein
MIKTLMALLVVAAFIGGCGSSSSSSSTASSSSAPATSSSTTAAASSSSASSSASGGSAIANNPAVKAAVAACKQRIAAAPNISADAKSKLSGLCDQAASGNEAGVLKAAAQVCQEIVKQSVPQAAQQQALASCPKA